MPSVIVAAGALILSARVGGLQAQDLTLLAEIGKEGDPHYTFFRPMDIALASDGRIAVLDAGDKLVRVYSPDGEFLFDFGGEGGGPGEFQWPGTIRYKDGQWEVLDPLLVRRVLFTLEGEHPETSPLPMPDGLLLEKFWFLEDSFSLGKTAYRASTRPDRNDPEARVILIQDGGQADTLVAYAEPVGSWHPEGRTVPQGGVVMDWMGMGGTVAVSGDSLVMVGDGVAGKAQFWSVGADGLEAGRTVDLHRTAVPAPKDRLAAVRDSIREAKRNRTIVLDAPESVFVLSGEALFADDGSAWIEYRTEGESREWARIDPDTGAMTTVHLPRPFRLKAVWKDRLYGFWTGDFDVQTVRVYGMG